MKQVAHGRLRFLDEAGATTVLTRLYARATGGSRATEAVPRNYGASTRNDFNYWLLRGGSDDDRRRQR